MKVPQSLLIFGILLSFLMILDVGTTEYVLSKNIGYEGNGFMATIISSVYLFVLVKIVGTGMAILIMKKVMDVNMNCAKIGMKLVIFLMLVVVGNNFFVIANAETGSLSIDAATGNSYTSTLSGSGGGASNLSLFFFYNDSYNRISKIDFAPTAPGYPLQADSTSFFCLSGGICTGTVSYDAVSNHIIWIINSGSNFSDRMVTLQYAKNLSIFTPDFAANSPPNEISLTKPVVFTNLKAGVLRAQSGTYIVQTAVQTTNVYNITYPTSGLFTVQILKNMSVTNTKISVLNFSAIEPAYFTENSYNLIGFNYTSVYKSGISIKMNNSNNDYDIVYVNDSVCSSCGAFTPSNGSHTNPPLGIPASNAQIQFHQSKYQIGDIINLEWAISDVEWNCVVCNGWRVEITDNNGNIIQDRISLNNQTGSFSYVANNDAIWTATLNKRFIVDTLIQTVTTQIIPKTLASIQAPATAGAGVNVSVLYNFGESVSNGAIQDSLLDSNGLIIPFSGTYSTLPNPSQSGTVNISFIATGKHRLGLWNFDKTLLSATTSISITGSNYELPQNITTNSLTLDNSTYSSTSVIGFVYSINQSSRATYNVFYITVASSTGSLLAQKNLNAQTGTGTIPLYQAPFMITGAANVNLSARTSALSATNVVLVSVPITITSSITSDGYQLTAYPGEICGDDKVLIKYLTPSTTATLRITKLNPIGVYVSENIQVSGSGERLFQFSPSTMHDRSVITFDLIANGISKTTTSVVYKKLACQEAGSVPTVSATPNPTEIANTQSQNQIDNLLVFTGMGSSQTSKFFFAILITAAVTIIGYKAAGDKEFGGIILGFQSYAFFTFIDYIPKWVIIILILILASKYFR